MSEPDLPDDLSRWPENPYRLLGVAPGVRPRDLRRAYTRLIRVYKPEQFPEHFRRIREAYETLLRHTDLFDSPDETPEPAPEPARPPDPGPREEPSAAATTPPDEVPAPAPPRWHRPRDLDEELGNLWRLAREGQEAEAYRRLVQLSEQHPGQSAVCLRLYWLLTVAPELDGRRSPCDWLAQGLVASGLTGPLRELYREEVEDDPAEALSSRYARLLRCDVRPGLLADLVEWRWRAAVRLGQWEYLAADVAALRPRLLREDEEVWLRLLFTLADGLAWVDAPPGLDLMKACRREIKEHEHLGRRLAAEFDRFDFLVAVSEGWHTLRKARAAPPILLQLVAVSWKRPFAEVRPGLFAVLERVGQEPRKWLDHFDTVAHQAAPVLAWVGRLLDQLEQELAEPPADVPDAAALRELALEFFDAEGPSNYRSYRPRFLTFCLREAVAPERVAEVAPDRPAQWPSKGVSLSQAIATDWPLRYVYRAYRLFWASGAGA
jgi:hypothetical protein